MDRAVGAALFFGAGTKLITTNSPTMMVGKTKIAKIFTILIKVESCGFGNIGNKK